MSFSWSSPINPPSIVGLKPTTSFADALKRLAEHVEQKNRTKETKANENSSLVHLSNDFSNRSTLTNENNGISSEQALRLYTQCVQEIERRSLFRGHNTLEHTQTQPGSLLSSSSSSPNNRIDNAYRFMFPPLANLIPSISQLQALTTNAMRPSASVSLNASSSRSSPTETTNKSTVKLFRPYELDEATSAKTMNSANSSTASSGKEKQLLNSLGLVQSNIEQGMNLATERSPSSTTSHDDSVLSDELANKSDDESDQSSVKANPNQHESINLKRKSSKPAKNHMNSHKKCRISFE